MGRAPQLVTVRAGVQLAPDAADSFRRLEAQLGRRADVNRTYADYDTQLRMYRDWQAYVNGHGPHPGHSRALHPDESMHCKGLAWDTDDWTTPGFIDRAAEHGWIRTAASDPTEQHHFEYQWWNDQHRNEPVPKEDDMSERAEKQIQAIHDAIFRGGNSMPDGKKSIGKSLAEIQEKVAPIIRTGGAVSIRQEIADTKTKVYALEAAVQALATAQGADPSAILAVVEDGVKAAMRDVSFTVDVE